MKKTLRKLSLRKTTFFIGSLLTLSFSSCIDANDDMPEPTPVTYVALYHGAPDAPDFDIFLDNSKINTQGFKYTQYSDYFNFVTPGSHRFKFTPTNAANTLIDTAITFQQDKIYSLFVVDKLQDMELMVVRDSLVTPGTGESSLRLVQLSPDAPTVDVVSVRSSTTSPLFADMDFKESTSFKKVASGTQTIQFKRKDTGEVLLSVPNITLEAGRNYSFILRGFATPPNGNTNVLSMQVIRNY